VNIQLFNKARSKSINSADKFSKLFECIDDDHMLPLLTGLDKDLNIYVWCLACDYKHFIGLQTYEDLIKYEGVSFDEN
jgi:hypothetical protein